MKLIYLILSIFILTAATGQQTDHKAKEILEKVSEKTKSFKTISAGFSFALENKEMEINEKNEGTIIIKGKKYRVDLPDAGVLIFSDGSTVWHYMKDGNQVTVSDVSDSQNELSDPASIFNIYEKGFRAKYEGETSENGKNLYKIGLFPDNDKFEVTEITVYIDKATMMIYKASLMGTDGNNYVIVVKNMETGKDYPDNAFVFNKADFPDVEVIDFR